MNINDVSNRTIFRTLVMISAFIGLAILIYALRQPLFWIGIAFFLALAINPAVDKLSSKLPKKSRGLAAGAVFLLTIALLIFVVISLIPPLVSQTQVLIRNLPSYAKELQNSNSPAAQFIQRYNLGPQLQVNQSKLLSSLSNLSGSAFEVAKALFSSLAATITVLVFAFFMLLEGPYWVSQIQKLQPANKREHRSELARSMYRAVSGYVTGNLLTSLVAIVATSIALTIIGIPFAIPLGVVVGILDLLPLIGASLGAVVVILVCLFSSFSAAIIMGVYFLIYQQLENHVLQPLVYSRTVKMSPLTVLISAIIGASMGGILGALVAIPVAASVIILIKDYLDNHQAKKA